MARTVTLLPYGGISITCHCNLSWTCPAAVVVLAVCFTQYSANKIFSQDMGGKHFRFQWAFIKNTTVWGGGMWLFIY